MSRKKTTLPSGKPTSATYIDDAGVERWIDGDHPVSTSNAFRVGYGENIDYFDLGASALASERMTRVVEERRKNGIAVNTYDDLSHKATERLRGINRTPEHWVVR